jgi:hypothetical protein
MAAADGSPVPPRSVFLQWPLLLREGERVLDDLAAWTRINMIELSNFYLDWGPSPLTDSSPQAAPLALPPEATFDGLSIPVVDRHLFDSLQSIIDLVHSKGFKVACNLVPLYIGPAELADLACVDITHSRAAGPHPQLALYGCPNNPDTVRYAEAMAREFVSHWPLDVLTLNHVEYSLWTHLGLHQLLACFCEACRARAESLGIDFAGMERDARSTYESLTTPQVGPARKLLSASDLLNGFIQRPLLAQWLHFRMESMTEFIARVVGSARRAAREHGRELAIGLEFQLPTLSRLVGTGSERVAHLFDWVTPKFPDYLVAALIPLAAEEIATKTGAWDVAALRRALRELLELGPGPDEYQLIPEPAEGIIYSNAFDLSTIERQIRHIEALRRRVPVHPYIWQYNQDLAGLKAKIVALGAQGLDGFFLWCWDRDLTAEALRASAGIL